MSAELGIKRTKCSECGGELTFFFRKVLFDNLDGYSADYKTLCLKCDNVECCIEGCSNKAEKFIQDQVKLDDIGSDGAYVNNDIVLCSDHYRKKEEYEKAVTPFNTLIAIGIIMGIISLAINGYNLYKGININIYLGIVLLIGVILVIFSTQNLSKVKKKFNLKKKIKYAVNYKGKRIDDLYI